MNQYFVSLAHSSERFSYLGIAKQNDGDKDTSKQYISDLGLKNSIGGRQDIGFDAETAVYLHCLKRISGYPMGKIFYWLDKKKNETDIVMNYGSELIPVEVQKR